MYCKIGKGDRRAKREKISTIIAEILQADPKDLLILCLVDQIVQIIESEKEIAQQVLRIVRQV